MDLGTLALRYVPFLLFMLIGLIVAFDARIRLRRPDGTRSVALVQLVLGFIQAFSCMAAIIVSPQVGLFDPGQMPVTTSMTTLVYLFAAIVSIPTLITGVVLPPRADPRRGFTTLALVLDVLAAAGCAYALLGPEIA